MIKTEAEVSTVGKEFYSPMLQALEKAAGKRECPEFTDEHFLNAGVGRCLNDVRSGRDWIQKAIAILKLPLTVSRFFISLKSERRLRFLEASPRAFDQRPIRPPHPETIPLQNIPNSMVSQFTLRMVISMGPLPMRSRLAANVNRSGISLV